ncbi:MAG: DUF3341 domain-containing protein [Oceanicaulis sp.]
MTRTLLAEFETPGALVRAAKRLREAGFERFETYSPMPVKGLDVLTRANRRRIDASALAWGLAGFALAFAVATWMSVVQYPLNVGGRPLFSWPAFFLPSFEFAILAAAIGVLVALFRTSGLPRLHNPLFDDPGFARASGDRFFIAVHADEADEDRFRAALEPVGAHDIREVGA